MAKAVQIKKGNVIKRDGQLWKVVDVHQTFTGKHGAYQQIKMTNLADGHQETVRYSSSDTVEKAFLTTDAMQYLYQDGVNYVFMDEETGDQTLIGEVMLKEILPYLAYNAELDVQLYEGKPVGISIASSVVLEVVHTEPAAKGDTATSVTKPAELETGLVVKVPGHIKIGEKISVDTRTGDFLGRA
jgi:elongation factor P